MDPIIKCQNLGVAYDLGKSTEVWALKEINLEIYPQEYVIFFGPSGCGKSTLLYTIAGLEFPTTGKIFVQGKDLSTLSQKELIQFHLSSIGMIFQAYYLIPNLSVKDNILLPQIFAKKPPAEREKRAKILMERFGILELRKRRPSLLSGGQQQRVAITRALINDPAIILADEPVGNLDSKNAEIVLGLIEELNKVDKKTIIHVTHDARQLHYANRVFYMKDGRIIRAVTNPEKPSQVPFEARKISELERLAQAYPYLTESRLRAKLIFHHLLLPYGIEIQEKVEQAIDQYLRKKITERELEEILDKPPISLYAPTAKDLTKKILSLTQEIEKIEEEKYPELTPLEEKAMSLRGYLLDQYSGQLSVEQIKRLEEGILRRLIGQFDRRKLERFLDLPFNQGGAGLNKRTARRFTREIEIILMK